MERKLWCIWIWIKKDNGIVCYQGRYLGEFIFEFGKLREYEEVTWLVKMCWRFLKYLRFLVVLTSGNTIITISGKVRLEVVREFMMKKESVLDVSSDD